MQVIDNCLGVEEFNQIQQFFLGPDLPWCFNSFSDSEKAYSLSSFQFVHTFFSSHVVEPRFGTRTISPCFDKISSLVSLLQLSPSATLRIKANLQTFSPEKRMGQFHVDMPGMVNAKTAICYINSNNGFTEFEDGCRVDSVEDRLVIFDSQLFHRGVSCTNAQSRVVLNLNYLSERDLEGQD